MNSLLRSLSRPACFALVLLGCLAPLRAQDASKVAEAIDGSLHWVRTHQDLASGSYGGVPATALVLRAFAQSPRQYVPSDGPFITRALQFLVGKQRPDGSIADPDTQPEALADATAMAVAALTAVPQGTAGEALQRAVAYVSTHAAGVAWKPSVDPENAEAARKLASALLEQRKADGSWEGPRGAMLATADNVLLLNGCWRVLKRETAAPAPTQSKPLPAFGPGDRAKAEKAMQRGADFLLAQALDPAHPSWGRAGKADHGLTAMVLSALASLPAPRPPAVQKALDSGLDWLVGEYKSGALRSSGMANYTTSAMVMALNAAGRAQDRELLLEAQAFLKSLQTDQDQGYSEGDRYYGGIGYGDDERPDLSNLSMALDALVATGLSKDDPAFQKALAFLQRCQNRSESNDIAIPDGQGTVKSGNDGGAVYAPGVSKAGFIELADGTKVPRSYGSMSYSLLRCYLFVGLSKDDPRVQAVWKWISANYTLDLHPGFEAERDPQAPYQGLFYYFHSLARSLNVYGSDTLIDAAGKAHAWRNELVGRIAVMQRQDGSWINENSPRWWEGNPVLASSYALLTLAQAAPAAAPAGR